MSPPTLRRRHRRKHRPGQPVPPRLPAPRPSTHPLRCADPGESVVYRIGCLLIAIGGRGGLLAVAVVGHGNGKGSLDDLAVVSRVA